VRQLNAAGVRSSAGMDAIEARLVLVQEVPPKQEVRFYAICGEHCEQLTSDAAVSILRAHVPQKPVDDLSAADMMVEISVLRAEMDRLRQVYEAAKTWRTHTRSWLADVTVNEALPSMDHRAESRSVSDITRARRGCDRGPRHVASTHLGGGLISPRFALALNAIVMRGSP